VAIAWRLPCRAGSAMRGGALGYGRCIERQLAIKRVSRNQQERTTEVDYNKNRLEGLTIRYIGTLVHIAALRRDLSFSMR
jgi:hypothetical protein